MAESTPGYEKLGVFYLGRPYDLAKGETSPEPVLYDSRDLVTHAVCVGMTGSGKTGLLVSLLEEAALDGVPALVIDPKGDLANLLLTFPKLAPEDFLPWVDSEAAARAGVTVDAFAAQQAETWKQGLAKWDQTPERIARLRQAADFALYTPGSEAGLPISILASFAAPAPEVVEDGDLMRERVGTLVASLLSLLKIDSDPIQGREHILLSTLFDAAWRQGRGLDLAALIQQIQKPPIERIGVMDVESFFPAKERFGLAMAINNLLGAPGFAAWMKGEPLSLDRLLYSASGKPRVAVLSIAHLSDSERMFFVALLLNQTLGWMRGRPGTTSLRAVLAMDEIFGYMPPVAEPPSKRPLLTLLKQARAYGLGLVLATQNPVDLDYKGLSNVGTWLIGRLQTERDKQRLMDGLEGAAAQGAFDRARMEQVLAGLGNRVFLLHNVHEDEPVIFQVRWAMSYLRGPLTRPEIKRLTDPVRAGSAKPAAAAAAAPSAVAAGAVSAAAPALPPDVACAYVAVRGKPEAITYEPCLLGTATVHYSDAKKGVESSEPVALLAPLGDQGVDWYAAAAVAMGEDDLESEPVSSASFAALPDAAVKVKSYAGWKKDLAEALFRTRRLELLACPALDLVSRPGEDERAFRIRLGDAAREKRDAEVEALRKKYAPKVAQLEDRIRRAEAAQAKQADQASSQTLSTLVSAGTSVLGALFGRRSKMTAASSAVRRIGRTFEERRDVTRAEENVEAAKEQLVKLNGEAEAAVAALTERLRPESLALEAVAVKPKKTDVAVREVTLAWVPKRDGQPAWDHP